MILLIVTGGHFTQVSEMFSAFNMPFLSYSTFLEIQSRYIFPAVHSTYKVYQDRVVERSKLPGKPVDIVGDGRCDSPGYSAKYGTYVILDGNTGEVIHFYIMHREIAGNSCKMEKEGLIKCLDKLEDMNISVNTLTTDRHLQIRKYMREKRALIKHCFDVWHFTKSIKKKLFAASKKKSCLELCD